MGSSQQKLFISQNGKCFYCGSAMIVRKDYSLSRVCTVDHVIPVGKGGRRHPDNEVGACNLCNRTKSDSSEAAFRIRVNGADYQKLLMERDAYPTMEHPMPARVSSKRNPVRIRKVFEPKSDIVFNEVPPAILKKQMHPAVELVFAKELAAARSKLESTDARG